MVNAYIYEGFIICCAAIKIAHMIWTDRREASDFFDLRDDVVADTINIGNIVRIVGTDNLII